MYLPRKSRSVICLPIPSISVNGPPMKDAVPPWLSQMNAPLPRISTVTTRPMMPYVKAGGRPPREDGSVGALMAGPDPRPAIWLQIALRPPPRSKPQRRLLRSGDDQGVVARPMRHATRRQQAANCRVPVGRANAHSDEHPHRAAAAARGHVPGRMRSHPPDQWSRRIRQDAKSLRRLLRAPTWCERNRTHGNLFPLPSRGVGEGTLGVAQPTPPTPPARGGGVSNYYLAFSQSGSSPSVGSVVATSYQVVTNA